MILEVKRGKFAPPEEAAAPRTSRSTRSCSPTCAPASGHGLRRQPWRAEPDHPALEELRRGSSRRSRPTPRCSRPLDALAAFSLPAEAARPCASGSARSTRCGPRPSGPRRRPRPARCAVAPGTRSRRRRTPGRVQRRASSAAERAACRDAIACTRGCASWPRRSSATRSACSRWSTRDSPRARPSPRRAPSCCSTPSGASSSRTSAGSRAWRRRRAARAPRGRARAATAASRRRSAASAPAAD